MTTPNDTARHKVPTRVVIKAVCTEFGITEPALLGPTRLRKFVEPRFVACWLMHRMSGVSYPIIGRLMNRDHTSILHGARRATFHVERKTDLGLRALSLEATLSQFKPEPPPPIIVKPKRAMAPEPVIVPRRPPRECLRCREMFRPTQDYRCCPACRSYNASLPGIASGFAYAPRARANNSGRSFKGVDQSNNR